MISFKKLLSIILSVSFLSVFTLSSLTLAEEDDCPRNPKGGYIRAICANELLNVGLYKTSDYVNVKNLGVYGDEEHCAFNFRALDEVFEKKKLISNKNLRNQYNLLKKKCEEPFNILEKDNILFIICGSLIGAVTGLFGFENSKNQDSIGHNSIDQGTSPQAPISHSNSRAFSSLNQDSIGHNSIDQGTSPQAPISHSNSRAFSSLNQDSIGHNSIDQGTSPQAPISHSNSRAFSSLIRGIIGTVTGAISTIMGLKIKSEIDKQYVCEQKSSLLHQLNQLNDANECNSHMFNNLLYFLERPEHITFDMVYYQVNTKENDFHWNPEFAGINYTKEELESFPQKFKEMAAKIRKNLEENGKLSPMNFLKPQDNTFQEESCINCQRLGVAGNEEL